ncbi:tRNA/rRNA methyltransferase [[Clostridium] sordellii]|uniref:Putative tRNA (cytidine(34)-2'-O)-methyltransferase n=1 Tax=Paraclostridium sordellii TaxID=1505 RepID=A0A0A1S452_PARSO|nr:MULTISPECIES: tRNA (uridine(34)/cytosine(34)/5-carboxymethylaminomethyluridine(34)-2'-O)-methyltransferase TrmL [Paeniclostridium]EPZ60861.1 tRNA (cytidine(34)-2'-O)-methyltransferase [[Clostridium] sordellii ATCC 9714] [Paeniclostridium sordellii ATCC 9714]MDU5019857.1 tRNA (uridine(34)/cytosine(34)/5-carboxymethylaminomethyluridine(34)-2'-O)-methyltransferase TrmL [Clostridiales bacterium]AUN15635.1 tRNA (cytidine(34)-2'-O)-methyltransferase [Paeniclostridium sordellii]EPZ60665.1 tRNA (cyt
MSLNIVLVEPEIPQNTGNIIRSCAATGTKLHLVRPLGFSMEDKYLKRAGLDYWDLVDIQYYDSFDEVREQNPDAKFFYSTTKAKQTHSDVEYEDNSFIVFGKETKGLPESLIMENLDTAIRIPMVDIEKARSLNLSNSVAIVLFEALRQIGYPNLR